MTSGVNREAIGEIVARLCPPSIDTLRLLRCVTDLVDAATEWTSLGLTTAFPAAISAATVEAMLLFFSRLIAEHLDGERRRLLMLQEARGATHLTVDEILTATRCAVTLEASVHLLPGDYLSAACIVTFGSTAAASRQSELAARVRRIVNDAHGFSMSTSREWHQFLHQSDFTAKHGIQSVEGSAIIDAAFRVSALWRFGSRWPVLVDSHGLARSTWLSRLPNARILSFSESNALEVLRRSMRSAVTLVMTDVPLHVSHSLIVELAATRAPERAIHDEFKLLLVTRGPPAQRGSSAAIPSWVDGRLFDVVTIHDSTGLAPIAAPLSFAAALDAIDSDGTARFRELSFAIAAADVDIEHATAALLCSRTPDQAALARSAMQVAHETRGPLVDLRSKLLAKRSHYAPVGVVLWQLFAVLQHQRFLTVAGTTSEWRFDNFVDTFGAPLLCDHVRIGPSRSEVRAVEAPETRFFVQWVIELYERDTAATEPGADTWSNPELEMQNLGSKTSRASMCLTLVRRFLDAFGGTDTRGRHGLIVAARDLVGVQVASELVDALLLAYCMSLASAAATEPLLPATLFQHGVKSAAEGEVNELNLTARHLRLSTLVASATTLIQMRGSDADGQEEAPADLAECVEWLSHVSRISGRIDETERDVNEFIIHAMWLCSPLSAAPLVDAPAMVACAPELWRLWGLLRDAFASLPARHARIHSFATTYFASSTNALRDSSDALWRTILSLGGAANPAALLDAAPQIRELLQRYMELRRAAEVVRVPPPIVPSVITLQHLALP